MNKIAIIGAGLAGCEFALYLNKFAPELEIHLFEQKPNYYSEAHTDSSFSELVCSNSLRSADLHSGIGLLKQEMRELGSYFMQAADENALPAGKALAVNRELFAKQITDAIKNSNITLVNKRIDSLSELDDFDKIIIASGPLTSDELSKNLAETIDSQYLYFYDAIAPIIEADSVDMDIAFWGSRYEEDVEGGDYLNCPMNKDEYQVFYDALIEGEKVKAKDFEKHFEGCMPIEALAERGFKTLTFGPLKPVGFVDPRSDRRPYALIQLRCENLNKDAFNLVGCQTKLTYSAQDEVFRLIPGLKDVKFLRYGSMHRNTYVDAPRMLNADLSLTNNERIHLIGQITGVEGYVESAASALWLAVLFRAKLKNKDITAPPTTTALGALLEHLKNTEAKKFQPSNVHFGLMPSLELDRRIHKKERKQLLSERAQTDFKAWLNILNL